MRAMRRLALVACACTVFVAGCGGASQEDEVKQAFDDYTQAVKDKDGEKLCDSIASPELAEMSSDERAKEIDLCKDESPQETSATLPMSSMTPSLQRSPLTATEPRRR